MVLRKMRKVGIETPAVSITIGSAILGIGNAGIDVAIETADVALMADDLTKVPYAIRMGKRSRKISRQTSSSLS